MEEIKLNIFISHPSDFLTDNKLHGDGLAAFEFINRLAQRGHKMHVAVKNYDISGNLNKNIILHEIKLNSRYSLFHSFEYIIRVNKLFNQICKANKIDLIHQLNPVKPGLSILLARYKVPLFLGLFIPYWPVEYGTNTLKNSRFNKLLYSIAGYILKKFDIIQQRKAKALLLSTPAADSRIYHQKLFNKIHYLPYGIDIDKFKPSLLMNNKLNDELIVLYVGQVTRQKGVLTLIQAFEEVNKILPNVKLLMAGIGPDLKIIENKIVNLKCGSNIKLLSFVNRYEISKLYQECTLSCIPSDGEPFGLVALEAMACGKPIVATNRGGLKYLIHKNGGIKVEPNDPEALSDALLKLLSDQNLRDKMGEFNRKLVEETYSWEKVIDKLESIYYETI